MSELCYGPLLSPLPPLFVPDPVVPLFVLGVPVLLGSSVEVVPDVLLPEPLVVPEPVAEPEPLVVPVGDDDLSEQPDNPIPRLKDMSAAVNKYLWFCIGPPFVCLQPLRSPCSNSNQYAIQQPCGRLRSTLGMDHRSALVSLFRSTMCQGRIGASAMCLDR
jgi:hypothetical protein